jgi:uncharacterized membrane protein (DUF2068 family)
MLTVQCPSCGSYNDDAAVFCYFCKKPLPISPDRAEKIKARSDSEIRWSGRRRGVAYERPGCVSVYAFLLLLSGGLGILAVIFFLADASSFDVSHLSSRLSNTGEIDPNLLHLLPAYWRFLLVSILVFSSLNLFIGWGLWTMRNWARGYILVTQGLAVLSGIPLLFFSIVVSKGNLIVLGVYILPLLFSGFLFVWFMENRKLFR